MLSVLSVAGITLGDRHRPAARRLWNAGRMSEPDLTTEGHSTGSGGEARPRRGRPGHDQATVLRRAVELFNAQGYDATSMGDLARELGIGKSALYHHVPSKEHLLAAALDEALDGLDRAVAAARADTSTSAYERLHRAVRGSVEILLAHLPAVTLLLRVRGNSEVEQAALRRRRRIDDDLAALVTEAVAEGSVRADVPPALASRLLFGMVNSLVEWARPDGPIAPEELADAVTALAFGGLAVGDLAVGDPPAGGVSAGGQAQESKSTQTDAETQKL